MISYYKILSELHTIVDSSRYSYLLLASIIKSNGINASPDIWMDGLLVASGEFVEHLEGRLDHTI